MVQNGLEIALGCVPTYIEGLGMLWELKKSKIWPLWVQNLTKKVEILDENVKNESISSLKMVQNDLKMIQMITFECLEDQLILFECFGSLKRLKYDPFGSKTWQRKWKFWTKMQKTRAFFIKNCPERQKYCFEMVQNYSGMCPDLCWRPLGPKDHFLSAFEASVGKTK